MEDEFIDEGKESAPTVNDESEFTADTPQADSADETKSEVSTVQPDAETEDEGKEVSTEDAEAKESEKDGSEKETEKESEDEKSIEDLIADADKEIANEKNSAYYRNGLKTYKEAFLRETSKIASEYEPLKDYGEVSKIVENLEILEGIDAFENNPNTNLPEPTVKPFVAKLVEKKGVDKAVAVMQELAVLKSPFNEGWTMAHEVIAGAGLNPERIEDFKKFAQNGYQLGNAENIPPSSEDLEVIPENLREAFISLSSEEREEALMMSEPVMERYLKGVQNDLDQKREAVQAEQSKAEREAQEKIEKQQTLYREINTRAGELLDESGGKLFNAFTESLVNAEIDEIEAIGIANTMSILLNSDGIEGKQSRAALEKIGITIDATLESTFNEWMQAAQAAAAFEKQGDNINQAAAVNRFNDLEAKLIRKANPIVAGLLKHKTDKRAERIESKNTLLADIEKKNNGLHANDGQQSKINTGMSPPTDFSDSAYVADEYR